MGINWCRNIFFVVFIGPKFIFSFAFLKYLQLLLFCQYFAWCIWTSIYILQFISGIPQNCICWMAPLQVLFQPPFISFIPCIPKSSHHCRQQKIANLHFPLYSHLILPLILKIAILSVILNFHRQVNDNKLLNAFENSKQMTNSHVSPTKCDKNNIKISQT